MRITLPSGTSAELVAADGAEVGLVITPDIFGLRPLYDDMAARLAEEWGMTTCVVEPFPGRDLGPDVEPRFAAVPSSTTTTTCATCSRAPTPPGATGSG